MGLILQGFVYFVCTYYFVLACFNQCDSKGSLTNKNFYGYFTVIKIFVGEWSLHDLYFLQVIVML